MIATIRSGGTGAEVRALQAQLNLALPKSSPLVIDGIFGPLTANRVRDFQKSQGLSADAVVGPKTWTMLAKARGASRALPERVVCDNGNPNHKGKSNAIAAGLQQFAQAGGGNRSGTSLAFGDAGPRSVGAPASMTIAGMTLIPLIGSSHEAPARAVYAGSLQYDRIFFTSQQGLEGRAFTIAVPCPPFVVASLPFGGFIQVLNLGTTPDADTVIHELGHAWQSQHASSATAYIANCLACQGAVVAANKLISELDPSVKTNTRWPVNFPMSAYAYRPGANFKTYGCEQIAEQIENNETSIRSHVTAQTAGARDSDNEKCTEVTNIRMEDRRAAGVKM